MSILSDNQKKLLSAVAGEQWMRDNFYLGGGTALAEYYLHHRYSEDLDFFSEAEFELSAIDVFLVKNKGILKYQNIDSQQSFNRNLFFLDFGNEVLKTEFTYYPFAQIEPGEKRNNLSIDSLIDIAVNKLFTIYQRPRSRDYIDLFLILEREKWSLDDLLAKAKIKFDWHIEPMQLGSQLLKAMDVDDHPRMLVDIEVAKWQQFFVDEARKLKDNLIK